MKNTILLFLFFTLIFSSCGEQEKPVVPESIRPVKYGQVKMTSDAMKESFSGSAKSRKETKMSFRVGGVLTKRNVRVGDVVRKGQLIARVDQTDYTVQLDQSVANLAGVETQIKSAETQMTNARATYNRVEKLYENNSVSLSEFEQAKSAMETAQAAFTAAKAQATASEKQVQSARNQVNYATLVAPYNGVITSVDAEENELVGSGSPIATISATDNPQISVGVPEVFISKVKKNQKVNIYFSSIPEKNFTGKVFEVGFSSLGGSTYPVTVSIDNPTNNIRPGMAAEVSFDFSTGKAKSVADKLVVPEQAVGEDSNGKFVFTLTKDGNNYIANKKQITIGELTNSGFEVKSGLTKGELVATAGLSVLLNGMKVRLFNLNDKK